MKEIRCLKTEVMIKDNIGEEKKIPVDGLELMRMAIEVNEANRKGLKSIGKALKVLEKIEIVQTTGAEVLTLEDSEFEVLYDSIDKTTWNPVHLRFGEFFREIERVKMGLIFSRDVMSEVIKNR